MESQATDVLYFGQLGQEDVKILTSAWSQICAPTSSTGYLWPAPWTPRCYMSSPNSGAINSFCLCSVQNCFGRALAATYFFIASRGVAVQDHTGHIMRWATDRPYKQPMVESSLLLLMFLKGFKSQKLLSRRPNNRSSSIALDLECGYALNDFFLHLMYAWKQPDYTKFKWIAGT